MTRQLHDALSDLDREAAVRAGDEDLILRAADAALARVSAPGVASLAPVNVGRRLVQVAAAAFLMLSASAGAAWWVVASMREAPTPQVEVAPARARVKRTVEPMPVIVPDEPVPLDQPMAEAASERDEERVAPRESPKRVVPADPATLFHAASVARGAGDVSRAQKLYGQLIAQHPDSDEAHVAHVALGKLLLSTGRASAAEREFRQYLDAGGGPLSEEALFSRAKALQRLDRVVEERAAWTTLLSTYPQSVYTSHASQRLSELQR